MRGRLPSGPEYVEQVAGSATAKERAKGVLETMAGACRVQEACTRLQISEPRFHQLRQEFVEAGVERMEPRPAGRPPRTTSPDQEEICRLQQRVAELELQLKLSQARAEIALVLPNAVAVPEGNDNAAPTTPPPTPIAAASIDPEKKTRRRRRRPRPRAPTPRKPT